MPSNKKHRHSLRANLAHETDRANRAEIALAAAMSVPSAFAVIETAILADPRAANSEWRRELTMALSAVRAGLAPNAADEVTR